VSYNTKHTPQVHDRTNSSKGNGGSNRERDYLPPIDPVTGLRLRHGNGCHEHDNCFTCAPELANYCQWGSYKPNGYPFHATGKAKPNKTICIDKK